MVLLMPLSFKSPAAPIEQEKQEWADLELSRAKELLLQVAAMGGWQILRWRERMKPNR